MKKIVSLFSALVFCIALCVPCLASPEVDGDWQFTVSGGCAAITGYTGATGNATGIHLHFEVYVNGIRVDPERFLAS